MLEFTESKQSLDNILEVRELEEGIDRRDCVLDMGRT